MMEKTWKRKITHTEIPSQYCNNYSVWLCSCSSRKSQFFVWRPMHLCLLYQSSITLMLLCLSVVDMSLVTSR